MGALAQLKRAQPNRTVIARVCATILCWETSSSVRCPRNAPHHKNGLRSHHTGAGLVEETLPTHGNISWQPCLAFPYKTGVLLFSISLIAHLLRVASHIIAKTSRFLDIF